MRQNIFHNDKVRLYSSDYMISMNPYQTVMTAHVSEKVSVFLFPTGETRYKQTNAKANQLFTCKNTRKHMVQLKMGDVVNIEVYRRRTS